MTSKHPETKKALLSELEHLKSILDDSNKKSIESSEAVSYALASHGMEKSHAASQSTEDIPVLSAVVDDMDEVEVASFSKNPFLPDSLKKKLASNSVATNDSVVPYYDLPESTSNPFASETRSDTLSDQEIDTQSTQQKEPQIDDDAKQFMIDQLVEECLPQIEFQLRARLTRMIEDALDEHKKS